MRRNDIVTVVLRRDLGKPRPAVVIQSDLFWATDSLVVLPFTSEITDITAFRVLVDPIEENGLMVRSHVMVDKVTNLQRSKVGRTIGRLDDEAMTAIARQLAFFLALG